MTQFTINAPPDWVALDLAADLKTSIESAVEERLRAEPEWRMDRRELAEILSGFATDAVEQEASMVAVYVGDVDGARVVANVMVFVDARDASAPVEPELGTLLAELSEPQPGDIAPREVGLVDVPAGRGVRVRALVELEPDDRGAGLPLETVQYWVPVAGAGEAFIVSASTPSLVFGEALIEAFDAIASTLEITGAG